MPWQLKSMDCKAIFSSLIYAALLCAGSSAQAVPAGDEFVSYSPRYRLFHQWRQQAGGAPAAVSALKNLLASQQSHPQLKSSDLVEILSALGQLEWSSEEPGPAIEHLSKSLALQEESPDTKSPAFILDLAALADSYLSLRNLKMAEQTYKQLIPLLPANDPRTPTILLDLAEVYATTKRAPQAEALCDQVLAGYLSCQAKPLTRFQLEVMLNVAVWYRKQHEIAKAKDCLQKLIVLCQKTHPVRAAGLPSDAGLKEQAERALLVCFFEEGQYRNAEGLLRKYPPELSLDRQGYTISFGNVCTGGGWLDAVNGDAADNPPRGRRQYELALKFLKAKQLPAAEHHFLKAMNVPDSLYKEPCLAGLGKCYQLSGNKEKLRRILRDVALASDR